MKEPNQYQQSMEPYATLTQFSHQVKLENSDLNIFYFEAGENHPQTIIMIHGLGDEADTWRHVFQPLAENFHVVALDLPGFGRSDKHDEKCTPQFFMKAITQLLEQLRIEKTILMGNSLSAILAHSLALSDPDRVSGLILVDAGLLQLEQPISDWSLRMMQLPLLGEWFYTRLRKDPDAAFDSLSNLYSDLYGLPQTDQDFLYTRVNKRVWSDGQRRAYFSTLRSLMPWVRDRQSTLPEQLSHLDTATLVIRGEFDPLFSEGNAKGIINVQPHAHMVMIPGGGHLPHQEHPDAFLCAINPWLDKIGK